MTMIDRVGPGPSVVPTGRTARSSGTDRMFRLPDPAAAEPAPAAFAAAPPVQLESLLVLQQADPPDERDRTAKRHGQALLAALTRLQCMLLGDGGAPEVLAELQHLADSAPAAADPALAAALDHVILRARIELIRRRLEPSPQQIVANP